jgi:purine-binding chemotaxis protein CheW
MQIIVFTLKEKYYAIPTEDVEEIVKEMPFTHVPKAPFWVEGLINIRGNAITLINLYKLLSNTNETEELCYNSIIILKNDDKKVAFAVDSVESVSEIDSQDIQMTDYVNAKEVAGIIRLNNKMISLISMEALFSINEG